MLVDEYTRIRQSDCKEILGYGPKYFYDEQKKYSWDKLEQNNSVYYLVPNSYVERRKLIMQSKKPKPPKLPQDIHELAERLQTVESNILTYSREIEARNNALIRYTERMNVIDEFICLPWWKRLFFNRKFAS